MCVFAQRLLERIVRNDLMTLKQETKPSVYVWTYFEYNLTSLLFHERVYVPGAVT